MEATFSITGLPFIKNINIYSRNKGEIRLDWILEQLEDSVFLGREEEEGKRGGGGKNRRGKMRTTQ